jgi:hypothetical protein
MRYWIKTEGELITVVYYAPTEGTIEVDAPDDFVSCGDTANKYKSVNGGIVEVENYEPPKIVEQ